ncbi:PaaX family transcriptional regulator C-terminal domain-containing protein [Microbacterium sp. GCM10011525]|uniref:PaaX family transcriptional regulator n=1 Tax=Microbacterium sp. GCM10011525 TaxID=3317335 RepID=UPI0012FAF02B|nr:regulator [Microbacterium sp. MAH-37]
MGRPAAGEPNAASGAPGAAKGSHAGAGDTVLDDIDARPGSTTSLLRTTIGLYLRRLDGAISSAALVRLAGDLGILPAPARTAIARLKQKGLLLSQPGGYLLNPAATRMLERGDRRIFEVRRMQAGDPWCLISATIPEARRDLRHQLRRRLQFIGAGSVAPGLWIVPGYLDDEVGQLLDELGARTFATLFRADDPRPAGPLSEAVARWWDLDALRAEHLRFQASVDALPDEPFAAYVRLIDSWRVLPYVDPGLPAELLPADWPGERGFAAFAGLSARLTAPAWEHVRAIA